MKKDILKGPDIIKNDLDCKFIRISPDAKDFDIYVEISKIYNHFNESTKKLTKESIKISLIENLSKRLSRLEFVFNHSIKSKALKYVVKKILPSI